MAQQVKHLPCKPGDLRLVTVSITGWDREQTPEGCALNST